MNVCVCVCVFVCVHVSLISIWHKQDIFHDKAQIETGQ